VLRFLVASDAPGTAARTSAAELASRSMSRLAGGARVVAREEALMAERELITGRVEGSTKAEWERGVEEVRVLLTAEREAALTKEEVVMEEVPPTGAE
jgi:hypothetical protein